MSGNCLLKIMIIVVDRGKGEQAVNFLRARNILFNVIMLGHGTAATQWADFTGLGDSKKEVVVTAVDAEKTDEVFSELNKEFGFDKSGRGIAFTVGLNSVSGKNLLNYCLGILEE